MFRKPPLWTSDVSDFADYQLFCGVLHKELQRRARVEQLLTPASGETRIRAFCVACGQPTDMVIDLQYAFDGPDGKKIPNWRERVECGVCRLNNRMRASLEILDGAIKGDRRASIYITEQVTSFYAAARRRYPAVIGSEYLSDGTRPGAANAAGVRFEDITALTFPRAAFDSIVSLDVLEHVPDYRAALDEFARCIRPGGFLLLSVPFELHRPETLVRASLLPGGEIKHHVEPEYHGDPLNGDGILAYYTFGWSLLEDLRRAGFRNPFLRFYWSAEYGYLGELQFAILAER